MKVEYKYPQKGRSTVSEKIYFWSRKLSINHERMVILMREKDFETIAMRRIEKAFSEEDCETLGAFLNENYTAPVKSAACYALRELASDDAVKQLLDALFSFGWDIELKALIIRMLSDMLTEEDIDAVEQNYDVKQNDRYQRLFYVLKKCVLR